jgi:ubiquinone/menaquinone biosynthesis C-methylase UbiE
MYEAKERYQDQQIAETYDQKRFTTLAGKFGHLLAMRGLRKAMRNCPPGSRFLDIPCGTGRLTMEIAKANFKVVGADVSKEMMAVAARKNYFGNLTRWVEADAEQLPFDDNEFDYLTSGRFLAHLPPSVRVRVLKEFSRVTKNSIIAGYHILNPLADISRYVRTRGGVSKFRLSRVSMKDAEEEIAQAGLVIKERIAILPLLHDYYYLVLGIRD